MTMNVRDDLHPIALLVQQLVNTDGRASTCPSEPEQLLKYNDFLKYNGSLD